MNTNSANQKGRARQIQQDIRHVLMHDWDPIGVENEPGAQDEYDSYIGGVYRLLAEDRPEEDIVSYLHHVQSEYIGLPCEQSELLPVARKLKSLEVKL